MRHALPGEVSERELRGAERKGAALVQLRLALAQHGEGLTPVVGLAGFANPVPADTGVDMPDCPTPPEPVLAHGYRVADFLAGLTQALISCSTASVAEMPSSTAFLRRRL